MAFRFTTLEKFKFDELDVRIQTGKHVFTGQEASGSKYEMKNASYTNDSFEKSEKSPQGTYTQFSKI